MPNEHARSFYDIETAREGWSVRELERHIAALLFERLSMNRNKEQVLALARQGQRVAVAGDVIKDPFVLEFLDLREKPTAHERDLEQAIIDRLESFLDNEQIHAARYQMYLPTEDELRTELARERDEAERQLRLASVDVSDNEGGGG